MKVKFGLFAVRKSSFEKFKRRNILGDPVDKVLTYNDMRLTLSWYAKRLIEKRRHCYDKEILWNTWFQ